MNSLHGEIDFELLIARLSLSSAAMLRMLPGRGCRRLRDSSSRLTAPAPEARFARAPEA
jgi:hypothetical protein